MCRVGKLDKGSGSRRLRPFSFPLAAGRARNILRSGPVISPSCPANREPVPARIRAPGMLWIYESRPEMYDFHIFQGGRVRRRRDALTGPLADRRGARVNARSTLGIAFPPKFPEHFHAWNTVSQTKHLIAETAKYQCTLSFSSIVTFVIWLRLPEVSCDWILRVKEYSIGRRILRRRRDIRETLYRDLEIIEESGFRSILERDTASHRAHGRVVYKKNPKIVFLEPRGAARGGGPGSGRACSAEGTRENLFNPSHSYYS